MAVNVNAADNSGRWLRRYKLFFIIGILFLGLQLFLAYKSFNIPLLNSNDYVSDTNSNYNANNKKISNHDRETRLSENHLAAGLVIDDEDIHSNSNLYSKAKTKEHNSAAESAANSKNASIKKSNLKFEDINIELPCDIVTREAISALHRAKTQECKQLIVNISCDIQNDIFYPKTLPNYCPNDNYKPNRFLGCYKDEKNYRILSGYYTNFKTTNSPKKCIQMCTQSGFLYAGVQYSTECFCGNDKPPTTAKLADPSCNMKCPGNPRQACGGYFTVNIYETGISKFSPQIAEVTPKSNEESVRIVFLLTLNGRALRQVHRLLKTLYNTRHYYFIHIDSRQDYLYRELLPLETRCSNIKLSRQRYSTIWGGASLLTMLLTSMEYLLSINWSWDFVINLSESDFPVKSVDKLVEFLTANKEKNFVKSHGREVQRFIQKQGLDKTFVECDTHMWRIGDRELPAGIQIDGGSDWIALSRNFVSYITRIEKDELITGLLKIFQHTLLPAESFFHTALRNSKFCNTYIDNNLHVTNWKRRLGCKCQYKHVVDWCGCSPNDFKPEDWPRLQATEIKQLYFARKFEPSINQAVILQLEEWIYGPYPQEYLNLNSYWQSIYHYKDKSSVDDALLTITTSIARINSISLDYNVKTILEVTSFFQNDHYKGFLVKHEGYLNSVDNIVIFETLAKPNQIAKSSLSSSIAKRIKWIEVSSDYDQKEQMSRNVGKMLGPNSEPILIFRMSDANGAIESDKNLTNLNLTALWINPTGCLVSVDDYHVEGGELASTNFIKPVLRYPLTPGEWTTKLLYRKSVIAQIRWLISPLQFIAKEEITQKQAEKFNYGTKYDLSLSPNHAYSSFLVDIEDRERFKQKSLSDSKRIGLDLQNWIDSVVSKFNVIKSTCIYLPGGVSRNIDKDNSYKSLLIKIESCESTDWSSYALDPKSDVSELRKT